jgi:hypothetical protein
MQADLVLLLTFRCIRKIRHEFEAKVGKYFWILPNILDVTVVEIMVQYRDTPASMTTK